ncbi:MAG: methyltransferase domain-containing protein [Sediminibacterium sp.]
MDAAFQRRIQRYGWDKASHYYESSWQQQLKPVQDKLMEMAQLKQGEKIIDIACGTGLVSFPAALQAGKDGFVLGTDISDRMVDKAAALAKEKQLENIQFQQMDAEILQVEDNSFDVAISSLGLMYVPDPLQAIREMYRVLKPGGRALAAVWGRRDHCGWADLFEIIDKRVASEVCPMFFNLGTHDILERNLRTAGFVNIHTERIDTLLQYESDEEACKAAFIGGPVALAYNKFTEVVKEAVSQEYLASIKTCYAGGKYKIPGEFLVAAGYK